MTLVTKDRDTLDAAARTVYERHRRRDPHQPLHNVNVVEWGDALLATGAVQTLPDVLRALAEDRFYDGDADVALFGYELLIELATTIENETEK